MSMAWPFAEAGFAGFAGPWLLLALPLLWLARRLLPPARSASAALRVPFGARLDAIAGAGGGFARSGHAAWWLWLAWALLVVGPALLAVTALSGPRFELVVAGLGLTAGGALFGLLTEPGVSVVNERRIDPR